MSRCATTAHLGAATETPESHRRTPLPATSRRRATRRPLCQQRTAYGEPSATTEHFCQCRAIKSPSVAAEPLHNHWWSHHKATTGCFCYPQSQHRATTEPLCHPQSQHRASLLPTEPHCNHRAPTEPLAEPSQNNSATIQATLEPHCNHRATTEHLCHHTATIQPWLSPLLLQSHLRAAPDATTECPAQPWSATTTTTLPLSPHHHPRTTTTKTPVSPKGHSSYCQATSGTPLPLQSYHHHRVSTEPPFLQSHCRPTSRDHLPPRGYF